MYQFEIKVHIVALSWSCLINVHGFGIKQKRAKLSINLNRKVLGSSGEASEFLPLNRLRITISCDFIIDTQAQFSYKIHGQNSGKQLFSFHQICHIMISGYQDLFVCCGAFIQNFYDVVHPEGNIYGLLPPPALSETFFCIYVLRISRTMKIASSCIMKNLRLP